MLTIHSAHQVDAHHGSSPSPPFAHRSMSVRICRGRKSAMIGMNQPPIDHHVSWRRTPGHSSSRPRWAALNQRMKEDRRQQQREELGEPGEGSDRVEALERVDVRVVVEQGPPRTTKGAALTAPFADLTGLKTRAERTTAGGTSPAFGSGVARCGFAGTEPAFPT
jgi:hypothetical protein